MARKKRIVQKPKPRKGASGDIRMPSPQEVLSDFLKPAKKPRKRRR